MPTLDEVINNPKEHYRALLALREVLDGTELGPHRARYLASRQEALKALRASKTWVLIEDRNEAVRLDGLRLESRRPATPLEGGSWTLRLPEMEHGMPIGFGMPVEAADLVSAVGQVDERFPLPSWWAEADRAARPWRHNKATP